MRLPWWFSSKESACNAGAEGLILGLGRSPGEGMATHSSILAWRIPWTEGPVELQSMGLQSRTQLKQFSRHAPIQECRLYNLLCVGGGVCKTLL